VRSSKFANLHQVVTLPIAVIDREYQEREEHSPNRVSHFFAFSPSSTSWRIASERPSSFLVAQVSMAVTVSFGKRVEIIGSTPSSRFGRPRPFLFLRTKIEFTIFLVYRKSKPRGSPGQDHRPGFWRGNSAPRFLKANPEATMSHASHAYKLSVLDEIDSTTTRAQDAPLTPRRDLSDLEDTLTRAVNMASIAVTLMEEKVFDVYAHYGDKEYHERRRRESPRPYGTYTIHEQDVETFMWTIYELHAQIRSARDQFCGTDDDAPVQAAAEATADQPDA
jgi:hypothetical protein